jgi:hypothetical protein
MTHLSELTVCESPPISQHSTMTSLRHGLGSFGLMLALISCGGDDDDDTGGGGGGSPGTTPSALEAKLAKCPVVSATSDPAASSCLVGTYEGKTLAGDDCSLQLGEDGAFELSSPKLSVEHTSPENTIFVFGHSAVSDFHQITWKVSDPLTLDTWYELDFEARFGALVPAADRKIQFEVTEHGNDSMQSVVCLLPL